MSVDGTGGEKNGARARESSSGAPLLQMPVPSWADWASLELVASQASSLGRRPTAWAARPACSTRGATAAHTGSALCCTAATGRSSTAAIRARPTSASSGPWSAPAAHTGTTAAAGTVSTIEFWAAWVRRPSLRVRRISLRIRRSSNAIRSTISGGASPSTTAASATGRCRRALPPSNSPAVPFDHVNAVDALCVAGTAAAPSRRMNASRSN